jgi:hypothetical protein
VLPVVSSVYQLKKTHEVETYCFICVYLVWSKLVLSFTVSMLGSTSRSLRPPLQLQHLRGRAKLRYGWCIQSEIWIWKSKRAVTTNYKFIHSNQWTLRLDTNMSFLALCTNLKSHAKSKSLTIYCEFSLPHLKDYSDLSRCPWLRGVRGFHYIITRKISSGGVSLCSWHQLYSSVFICNRSVVIIL